MHQIESLGLSFGLRRIVNFILLAYYSDQLFMKFSLDIYSPSYALDLLGSQVWVLDDFYYNY